MVIGLCKPKEKLIEEEVISLLTEKGLTLAVAESCTGGLLSARLINVANASRCFLGGFVVYSNVLKMKFLSVEEETIKKYGAVSEEVCRQMAVGCLEETDADISIAITGIAGPGGGTLQRPVGLTYIALATDKEVLVEKYVFTGNRNENRFMATQKAMEILIKYLKGES